MYRFVLFLAMITACGTSRSNPMVASDELAPVVAAKTAGSVVTPTRWFMFVWGNITTNGVPAPVGTVVAAVDRAGNVAGQFTVWYPGYYGAMAVYLDDPATTLDEGAVTGEWLSIRVNGRPTRSKFQWTGFGDIVRVDVVVGSTVKKGGPLPVPGGTGGGAGSGGGGTTTVVKK